MPTNEPLPGVEDYAKLLDSFRKPVSDEFLPPPPASRSTRKKTDAVIPMTPWGQEVCGRLKELFYAYDNRKAEDNRSAQTTLGPSEIGTSCDRRLALSLMRTPPVNPGGDGWAAAVGTAGHAFLAEMFVWANADTGRYAVEVPLEFPSRYVPKGTGDLLDRTLCAFLDHKFMGGWSLNKLSTQGPSETYRVQVHTYAYGARLKGEDINRVAIIGWPRDKSSLDNLYVWDEPYNPQVARDALARVDRIAAEVDAHQTERATWAGLDIDAANRAIGREFPIDNTDCKYCPFHAPGDAKGERGCNGRI